MSRIAYLVGVNADKPGFYLLVPGNEIAFFKRSLIAKMTRHRRNESRQECFAAAQLHLKEQTLRLMNGC